jgi:hypothetical protein
MLLINVHELDVVLAHPVRLWVLELQVHNIRRILRLECEDVLILSSSQDFREGGEVDAESDVAIAAEGREGLRLQHHRDEGDVGVVHRLQRDTGVIAVEVAVLNEVFDRVDDLRVQRSVKDQMVNIASAFLPSSEGPPLPVVPQA